MQNGIERLNKLHTWGLYFGEDQLNATCINPLSPGKAMNLELLVAGPLYDGKTFETNINIIQWNTYKW